MPELLNGLSFTLPQLEGIAQVLLKEKLTVKLTQFVADIEPEVILRSPILVWALVLDKFANNKWTEVVNLISENEFDESRHKALREMWDKCHYKLYESKHGRYPQEVQRFRIRKKQTYPKSIWNGDEYKYLFTVKDREIMEKFFDQNPHPNRSEKEKLSNKTDLTIAQGKIHN